MSEEAQKIDFLGIHFYKIPFYTQLFVVLYQMECLVDHNYILVVLVVNIDFERLLFQCQLLHKQPAIANTVTKKKIII